MIDAGILIVGIGNIDCGDDGAGIETARHIRSRNLPSVYVVEQSGEGTDLVNLWQTINATRVYLIDAVLSGSPPGTIHSFEAHTAPLPGQFASAYSTHSFGLAEAIELARILNCLPPRVIVYGIEGLCFKAGTSLSDVVREAVLKTSELICAGIGNSAAAI